MGKQALVFFDNFEIRKINKNGEIWISALDVAKALEYINPAQAVNTILKRNVERFEGSILVDKLSTNLSYHKSKSMTFLNLEGVISFCLISNQKQAIPFQKWAVKILKKEILNIPDNIRLEAKKKRIEFTDTLKERGYTKPYEYIQTTKQMKKELNIEKKKEDCDLIEVMKIACAEMLAKTKIMKDEELQGYNKVNPVCIEASKNINDFVENKKLED